VLLNLKFRNLRTLCTASASGECAFIFEFCALVKRKIPRGVLMQIPREAYIRILRKADPYCLKFLQNSVPQNALKILNLLLRGIS